MRSTGNFSIPELSKVVSKFSQKAVVSLVGGRYMQSMINGWVDSRTFISAKTHKEAMWNFNLKKVEKKNVPHHFLAVSQSPHNFCQYGR